MKSRHILLKKAYLFKKKEIEIEKIYFYDNILGFWIKSGSNIPAIIESNFLGPVTKKNDIETGEDQKGE